MKYLTLLTSLFSVAYAGCPSMCNCEESSVNCVEKNLEYVPNFESLINNPIIIDLSGNKIPYISNGDFSFDKSNEVKEIYLNNSEIIDIDSTTFEETENLQELYLGQNLLNGISEYLIEHLDNMILLDISNNYFSGDMPRIRSNTLEVLAIANSKITSIPTDALTHLPNLKLLLLQENNIKSLSLTVFKNIKQNFFFVRLSYNSWECNCDNTELFQLLAARNFIDPSEPYQCINKNEKYVNIFDKNGKISNMQVQCKTNNIVTKQLDTDFSDFKQLRTIIDEVEEFEKEDTSTIATERNSKKSFSLIKTNNEGDSEGDSKTKGCENSSNSNVVFDLDPRLFVALAMSFLLGFLTGISLFCLASLVKRRKLETSDSATRLIVT